MLDRKIRKRVEYAFYNYKTLKEQGANYIVELAESGLTARLDSVGGSSGKSNPTEAKGIKAAECYDAIPWCRVVERTKKRFMDEPLKLKLIEYRYERKTPIKQLYTKHYDKFYASEKKTFYNWLDEILTYAAMLAIQERIIKL